MAKKATLEIDLDAGGVKQGASEVVGAVRQMGASVAAESAKVSSTTAKMGDGGQQSAIKLDAATRNMISAIQRQTAAFQAGERGSRQYFEAIANQRGVSGDVLKPYLDSLEQAKSKQEAAAVGADKLGGAFGTLKLAAAGAAAAILAYVSVDTARAVIAQADAVSLLDARLRLAVGGASEFKAAQTQLFQLAQSNSVGLSETVTLYTRLADPIKRLGGGMQEVIGVTNSFQKALQLGGVSAQEAASATLQFGQALGAGALAGDEFKSLAEASPRLLKAIAEGANLPIEQLKKLGSEGKLTAELVSNALLSQRETLEREFATLPDTVGKSITRMANVVTQAIGEMNTETGLTTMVAGLVDEFTKLVPIIYSEMGGAIQAVGVWMEENKTSIRETVGAALDLVAVIWDVAKQAASVIGFLAGWTGETKIVATSLQAVGILIAGLSDGVRIVGAAFAAVGSVILQAVLAPVQAVLSGLAKVSEIVGRADWSATISNASAAMSNFSKAGMEYGSAVVESFQNGNSAVAQFAARVNSAGTQLNTLGAGTGAATGGFKTLKSSADSAGDSAKKAGRQAKEAKDEFAELYNKLTAKDLGIDPKFYQNLNTLHQGYEKGRISIDQYREAVGKLVSQQQFAKEIAKQNGEAYEQMIQSIQKASDTAAKQSAYAKDMLEALKFEAAALRMTNQEREIAIKLRDLEKQGIVKGTEAYEQYAEAIKAAVLDKQAIEQGIAAQKKIDDEAKKTADSINQSLTDALLRGFESGKGFAKNFRDTLKNMFRTLVLRPIISFIVQPIGNAISAVVNGFLGGGQGGGILNALFGSQGSGVNMGGLMQGAGSLNNMWGLFSNWMGFGTGAGAGTLGLANGVGMMGGDAMGTFIAANGGWGTTGVMGGGAGGAGGISGIAAGAAVVAIPLIIGALAERASRDRIGGAAYASSDPRKDPVAGAGSGTRYDPATGQLPEYQAMVDRLVELGYGQTQEWYARFKGNERALYMLTQLVESEAAMGAEHFSHVNPQDMIDRYGDFYRGAGAADPQAMGWWNWKGNEAASVDPAAITLSRTVAQSIVGPLTSLSELIGGAADDLRVSVGYAQRGPGKGVWAGMRVERNGETISDWTNKDDYHSVGEAVQGMYSHALEVLTTEFDLPKWAQDQATAARAELDKLSGDDVAQQSATLYNNTTANIAQTYASIQQLIDIFPTFSDATQDTVHALAEAAGGMDKLSSSYASYVSHFYSASEQQSFAWAQIQSVLGKVNLLVPATREGFRELVESLDLSTEAGRNAFNALMQVESAFYNLTEAAETSADTMGMTKDSVKGMFSSILEEAQSAAEARQMAEKAAGEMVMNAISDAMINSIMGPVMDSIVAPMVASITAGATTGGAALASGGAMGGSAVAAGGAAGGGAVAAGGAQGGGAVAAGGASAGSSMAAGGGAAGASVASALQQVRTTLGAMTQVFSSPEFAEMYRTFTGAMGEIGAGLFGSMDAVAMAVGGGGSAGGGGGQGQAPSGKAVDELAEALKRLGKTVSEEVKRLRGLINDESDFGLAYLKAQFATATAQARAGDLDALGKLTGLSKSIDDMTKATAMSEIENVRNRAWLADSLEATLNSLGLKLEDFEKSGGPTVGDTSGLSQSTPGQGADIAAVVRTVTVSGNADLLVELRGLRAEVAELKAAARDTASNTNKLPRMSDQFDNVTEGGNAMRVEVMP